MGTYGPVYPACKHYGGGHNATNCDEVLEAVSEHMTKYPKETILRGIPKLKRKPLWKRFLGL